VADPGEIDFVPAACEAQRIAGCIIGNDCQLEDFELPSVEVYFTDLRDNPTLGLAAIQLQINALDACFLTNLALAFAEAGCDLPSIPQPPDPGEITEMVAECLERVQEGVAEQASALGEWAKAMTVTFGEDSTPTRIQVP
jgi:hypothetical protein